MKKKLYKTMYNYTKLHETKFEQHKTIYNYSKLYKTIQTYTQTIQH